MLVVCVSKFEIGRVHMREIVLRFGIVGVRMHLCVVMLWRSGDFCLGEGDDRSWCRRVLTTVLSVFWMLARVVLHPSVVFSFVLSGGESLMRLRRLEYSRCQGDAELGKVVEILV